MSRWIGSSRVSTAGEILGQGRDERRQSRIPAGSSTVESGRIPLNERHPGTPLAEFGVDDWKSDRQQFKEVVPEIEESFVVRSSEELRNELFARLAEEARGRFGNRPGQAAANNHMENCIDEQ